MRYQDKEEKKLRGIFPPEFKADKARKTVKSSSVLETGQYYAISSEGEINRRFEIILASGKKYSFSYAILPVCILDDNTTLYIKAYALLITIAGRNLEPIHEHFGNELISWIKASSSGKDNGDSPVFIKEIRVEGKSVEESI